ncbi:MAG: bifunctional phosphoglucose/phosphomannose isomerase [Candidatus Bathyarchaeota archaeon]|nr:bifunctional phosphoglucose/phosphomannose isomerase [Candidatus Bathyarchaeota archaeon]
MTRSPLDEISEIKEIDKSGMLSFSVEAAKHYAAAAQLAKPLSISYAEPANIVVAGMGGSAISGELLKDWARDKITVPIEVSREYSLPAYAGKSTLALVTSYSGETEEALSAFLDALKRKCMTVCISSGGALQEFAEKLGVPHLRVPAGMAPRATLPYLFMPLPMLLEKLGLVSKVAREISETTEVLAQVSAANAPELPLRGNFSKSLASNICGYVPVVYGFAFYRAVAQRFKQQFNENSKVPAKWEVFPELNHNEIVGWENHGTLTKNFSAIFIRDKAEPAEVRSRIETTKTLMQPAVSNLLEVWAQGKSPLAKMLSTICIGDFASVYLAILRKIDPTPVKTIASLKQQIKQTGLKEKIIRELAKLAS